MSGGKPVPPEIPKPGCGTRMSRPLAAGGFMQEVYAEECVPVCPPCLD